jgi:DNA repair ATPase RecN
LRKHQTFHTVVFRQLERLKKNREPYMDNVTVLAEKIKGSLKSISLSLEQISDFKEAESVQSEVLRNVSEIEEMIYNFLESIDGFRELVNDIEGLEIPPPPEILDSVLEDLNAEREILGELLTLARDFSKAANYFIQNSKLGENSQEALETGKEKLNDVIKCFSNFQTQVSNTTQELNLLVKSLSKKQKVSKAFEKV